MARPQRFANVVAAQARQHHIEHDQRGMRFRSEEHTSELQSQSNLVCRLLLEKKKTRPPPCRPWTQAIIRPPLLTCSSHASERISVPTLTSTRPYRYPCARPTLPPSEQQANDRVIDDRIIHSAPPTLAAVRSAMSLTAESIPDSSFPVDLTMHHSRLPSPSIACLSLHPDFFFFY